MFPTDINTLITEPHDSRRKQINCIGYSGTYMCKWTLNRVIFYHDRGKGTVPITNHVGSSKIVFSPRLSGAVPTRQTISCHLWSETHCRGIIASSRSHPTCNRLTSIAPIPGPMRLVAVPRRRISRYPPRSDLVSSRQPDYDPSSV